MLAIASLATGFVVAAITPSHALDAGALGSPDVDGTLSTLDRTPATDSLAAAKNALGQEGQAARKG